MASAKVELKTLNHVFEGEVGEVMQQVKPEPIKSSVTIFQSMGKFSFNYILVIFDLGLFF